MRTIIQVRVHWKVDTRKRSIHTSVRYNECNQQIKSITLVSVDESMSTLCHYCFHVNVSFSLFILFNWSLSLSLPCFLPSSLPIAGCFHSSPSPSTVWSQSAVVHMHTFWPKGKNVFSSLCSVNQIAEKKTRHVHRLFPTPFFCVADSPLLSPLLSSLSTRLRKASPFITRQRNNSWRSQFAPHQAHFTLMHIYCWASCSLSLSLPLQQVHRLQVHLLIIFSCSSSLSSSPVPIY